MTACYRSSYNFGALYNDIKSSLQTGLRPLFARRWPRSMVSTNMEADRRCQKMFKQHSCSCSRRATRTNPSPCTAGPRLFLSRSCSDLIPPLLQQQVQQQRWCDLLPRSNRCASVSCKLELLYLYLNICNAGLSFVLHIPTYSLSSTMLGVYSSFLFVLPTYRTLKKHRKYIGTAKQPRVRAARRSA